MLSGAKESIWHVIFLGTDLLQPTLHKNNLRKQKKILL
jgi:hypothetical protein